MEGGMEWKKERDGDVHNKVSHTFRDKKVHVSVQPESFRDFVHCKQFPNESKCNEQRHEYNEREQDHSHDFGPSRWVKLHHAKQETKHLRGSHKL